MRGDVDRQRRDLWREAAIALAAIVLTLGGSWLSQPAAGVTPQQVREISRSENPYIADRSALTFQLAQANTQLTLLVTQVGQLRTQVASLQARR